MKCIHGAVDDEMSIAVVATMLRTLLLAALSWRFIVFFNVALLAYFGHDIATRWPPMSREPCGGVHLIGAANDEYAVRWFVSVGTAAYVLGVRNVTVIVPPDRLNQSSQVRYAAGLLTQLFGWVGTLGPLSVTVAPMYDEHWSLFSDVYGAGAGVAGRAMAPHLAAAGSAAALAAAKLVVHQYVPRSREQLLYLDADTVVGYGSARMHSMMGSRVLCQPTRRFAAALSDRELTRHETTLPTLHDDNDIDDDDDDDAVGTYVDDLSRPMAANWHRRPFNSGVLKINATWWRQQYSFHGAVERYARYIIADDGGGGDDDDDDERRRIALFDQTLLNALVGQRWMQFLPDECNTPTPSADYIQVWPFCIGRCVCHWMGAIAKNYHAK